MNIKRGTRVKHIGAEPHTPHTGVVQMARHARDLYLVRWTATFQDGVTRSWVGEHSRMALRRA